MTLLGASAFASAPAAVAAPQDAIEPVNRKKNRNPIHQKMKHFFCLEICELYFSFFNVVNQNLFWWLNWYYTQNKYDI